MVLQKEHNSEGDGGSQWVLSGRVTASLWEGVGFKSQLTARLAGSPWTGSFPSPSPNVLICKNGDAGWLGLLTEWVALKCLAWRHPASRHLAWRKILRYLLSAISCVL